MGNELKTVQLKKGSAVIRVNADDTARWLADGFQPLDAPESAPAPAAEPEVVDDPFADESGPPRGKRKKG